MAVAHLAADDPRKVLATKSGRVLFTPDLAYEYGFRDLDGGVRNTMSLVVQSCAGLSAFPFPPPGPRFSHPEAGPEHERVVQPR